MGETQEFQKRYTLYYINRLSLWPFKHIMGSAARCECFALQRVQYLCTYRKIRHCVSYGILWCIENMKVYILIYLVCPRGFISLEEALQSGRRQTVLPLPGPSRKWARHQYEAYRRLIHTSIWILRRPTIKMSLSVLLNIMGTPNGQTQSSIWSLNFNQVRIYN